MPDREAAARRPRPHIRSKAGIRSQQEIDLWDFPSRAARSTGMALLHSARSSSQSQSGEPQASAPVEEEWHTPENNQRIGELEVKYFQPCHDDHCRAECHQQKVERRRVFCGNTHPSRLVAQRARKRSLTRRLIGTSRRPSAVLLSGTKIMRFCQSRFSIRTRWSSR